VAVDEQDQMHWDMRPDDPQLLGRELLIRPDTITFTGDEKPTCQQSTWKTRTLEWSKLFAKTFSRSPGDGKPLPSDFGLKIDKAAKATYYEICPPPGAVSQALAAHYRRWVAQREADVLVMHYSDQVLLTLRRRPKDAKPRASFDCGKASTPTETTICASFELAGWDRSVATAFKQALKRSPGKAENLRVDQRRWLTKRDACGAKTDCIDEMLWRRVEELGQR
jgi:uncharacterized protein YecT (DUF1311 family)